MPSENSSNTPIDKSVFEIWCKYEEVAMHFNDLLIRLRTQALAAVAAISALVSLFAKSAAPTDITTWHIATVVMFILLWLWIALWILDLLYYNRLLLGSVDAIIKLEECNDSKSSEIKLSLSRVIKAKVEGRDFCDGQQLSHSENSWTGVHYFYILVFILLAGLLGYCFWQYKCGVSS